MKFVTLFLSAHMLLSSGSYAGTVRSRKVVADDKSEIIGKQEANEKQLDTNIVDNLLDETPATTTRRWLEQEYNVTELQLRLEAVKEREREMSIREKELDELRAVLEQRDQEVSQHEQILLEEEYEIEAFFSMEMLSLSMSLSMPMS
eukprot:jgi/Psemu1/307383/fgenesh1_kg.325_\